MKRTTDRVTRIAVVGDFQAGRASHIATSEALHHAARASNIVIAAEWVATPALERQAASTRLKAYDAILCAPGGPYRSTTGALDAIRFAREEGWPFLGT